MAPIRWVAGTALALAFAGCSGLVTDSDLKSDGGAPPADGRATDAGPPPPPPNIILILTDDQRWDAWGHGQADPDSSGRLPWMIGATPNMDRLAAEGVHFTNAFVVSALCSPSRAAFHPWVAAVVVPSRTNGQSKYRP